MGTEKNGSPSSQRPQADLLGVKTRREKSCQAQARGCSGGIKSGIPWKGASDFVLTIGDVGMLGEDEKNDLHLELADVGTNDAEGDVDEGGENLAAADVGDGAGSGTMGEVTDRVRKIRVPMILCPKVLNADMSLRASAKAIADFFSVGEWARNDSVFQRPIAIESKAGFDDGSPWVDSKCCLVMITPFEKWDAEAGRLKLEQVCWWLTDGPLEGQAQELCGVAFGR
jgi:hypothetical protein